MEESRELHFTKKRRNHVAPNCPCGEVNSHKNPFFSPFDEFEGQYGHCHKCDKTFMPDSAPQEGIVYRAPEKKPQRYISPEPVFDWLFPDTTVDPVPAHPIPDGEYLITWYYRDIKGRLTSAKQMYYRMNNTGLSRIKDKHPRYPYLRDSGYYGCIFYERDLHSFPSAKVILLESEKTAALMRRKFKQHLDEFIYLAVGGANGLTDDKIHVLKDRDVLIIYDCDNGDKQPDGTVKNPKGREAAESAALKLSAIAKPQIIDLYPDRNDGTDLGDVYRTINIDFLRSLSGKTIVEDKLIVSLREFNRQGKSPGLDEINSLSAEYGIHPDKINLISRTVQKNHRNEHGIDSGPLIQRIEHWMSRYYEFRRNTIETRVYFRKVGQGPWRPCNESDLWRDAQYAQNEFGKRKVIKSDLENILDSQYVPDFNPFMNYFESLPPWDGQDHITRLANHIQCEDQTFWVQQFKKSLVRMLACTIGHIENRIIMTLVQEVQESGKCLGRGTKIVMADWSLRYVEEIKVGDQIMGVDGTPRNVLETHQGIDQMYWVRQNNGVDYRVNSNHILSLKKRKHRETYMAKSNRIINIHLNQYLKLTKQHKFSLMGWKPKFDFDPQDVPIDPYFLGLWLGDGSSGTTNITACDHEVVQYLEGFVKENGFKLTVWEKKGQNNKAKTYSVVQNHGSGSTTRGKAVLRSAMSKLNLLNNKHIPDIYLKNSREIRLKLLAGIIDSDGHLQIKTGRAFEVTFKSYGLAKNLEFLCRSLGFRANTNKKTATMKRKDGSIYSCDVYRTHIYGTIQDIPVLIKRKKARVLTYKNKPPLLTGISIEEDCIDEYFGFTTDGDQLFMLEDFTVTHNSSYVRFLCPQELQDYYKESPMEHTKDSDIALAENFIWNLEELADLNKKEIAEMKAFISRKKVKQRRAYARHEESLNRIVNFWGSTNKTEFLSDTQNTRWLCFNVISINHDYNNYSSGVRNIDINAVWAQAWHLYRTGFIYNLTPDEREHRDNINHNFESMTDEKSLILRLFEQAKPDEGQFMSNLELFEYLLQNTSQRLRLDSRNIGRSMSQLGFKGVSKKVGGKTVRGYWIRVKNKERDDTPPPEEPMLFTRYEHTPEDSLFEMPEIPLGQNGHDAEIDGQEDPPY